MGLANFRFRALETRLASRSSRIERSADTCTRPQTQDRLYARGPQVQLRQLLVLPRHSLVTVTLCLHPPQHAHPWAPGHTPAGVDELLRDARRDKLNKRVDQLCRREGRGRAGSLHELGGTAQFPS